MRKTINGKCSLVIVLNCGLLITRLISKHQNLDSESALNTNGELPWIKRINHRDGRTSLQKGECSLAQDAFCAQTRDLELMKSEGTISVM